MPKIGHARAQVLAEEKYGAGVFVGDLNEVWQEARNRAAALGYPCPGQINVERLDGAWWDDDNDRYAGIKAKEVLTDDANRYWFVLLQKQPWDDIQEAAQKEAEKIKTLVEKKAAEYILINSVFRLKMTLGRIERWTGKPQKLEDYIDLNSLPAQVRERALK